MRYDLHSWARRYVFAIHGSRWYDRRRAMARRRSAPRGPADSGASLAAVVDPENLLRVFRRLRASGGQAVGVDGLAYIDFSIAEIAAALRQIGRACLDRRYLPYPTRVVRIRRPDGRYRELRIGTVCDRIVAAAIQEAIGLLVESISLPCSFGFRRRRSVWLMLATMMDAMVEHGHYVVWTDDVADAFPSVQIETAVSNYRQLVHDEGLLWLIETCLRGSEGAAHIVGIDQGSPLGPNTFNHIMHTCLDRPYTAVETYPPLYRYVDNLHVLASSVTDGLRARDRITALLTDAGFRLKGTDGAPIDLRRQGARKPILGYLLSAPGGRPRLGISPRAWADLRATLPDAHLAPHPALAARQITEGWCGAYAAAVESEETEGVAARAYQLARQSSLDEMIRPERLARRIVAGAQRWERLRDEVRGRRSAT